MDLSICIPTLNSRQYLKGCLDSIARYAPDMEYEIIIVDNASTDDTVTMLEQEYPQVRLLRNDSNLGFSRPMNQAMRVALGDFFLALNPDTLLIEDIFTSMLNYLRANPKVGLAIPKVLNQDGSFQKQSRRGEARPAEVFGYFFKLGRLFPKSRALNGYLQDWLPEDEVAEVKAVSGSCMFIRRETWGQVGGFDEALFAYQEDSDYCLRARQSGWKVMYVPLAKIIHYGGQGGSKAEPVQSIYQWHRSYYLYYRKHFAKDYFFLFNWLYYLVMAIKLVVALVANLFRSN